MEPKRLGKYILVEKIGEGATSEVYRGRDLAFDQEVAIKILKPGLDQDTSERFRWEARSVNRLAHPAIVKVRELGQADGRLFIVMDYIAGVSLDGWIKKHGPLPWAQVLKLAQQVGGALDYAHHNHILHRDIKPGNIMVTSEGNFILSDFGLARALQESSATSTGGVKGTPYYIAPELWDEQPASPASDQYALACVICEALTGKILFRGGSQAATMKKHLDGVQLNEILPPELVSILCKALDKDPNNRYPTLQEFAEQLVKGKLEKSVRQAPVVIPRKTNWGKVVLGRFVLLLIVLIVVSYLFLNGFIPSAIFTPQPGTVDVKDTLEAARKITPEVTQSITKINPVTVTSAPPTAFPTSTLSPTVTASPTFTALPTTRTPLPPTATPLPPTPTATLTATLTPLPPTPTLPPPTPSPAALKNLVNNGDFRSPWTTGWYQYGNPSVIIENPKRRDAMWLRVAENAGDRWVSGACQDVNVAGIKGLRFEADVLLQVARFSSETWFTIEEPWSMGAVLLVFYDAKGQSIGQAWWYATRREGYNPASDQPGFNHGTVFTMRLEAFKDAKIQENLSELATKEIPYMNQNDVSKISICLVAASQKAQYHYPGDGWMTNIGLYSVIP